MNFHEKRQIALKVFIGFLIVSALLAIVAVLQEDFGETQFKILASTFTIAAASFCAMACMAFIAKRNLPEVGWLGVILAAVTALAIIGGVWIEVEGEAYWKISLTLVVISLAIAHILLLAIPDLNLELRWIQSLAFVAIALLALVLVVALWGGIEDEWYARIIVVVSVLVALFTLLVPVLTKMRKPDGEQSAGQPGTLMLTDNGDGTYTDSSGTRYSLTPIDDETGD